MHLTVDERLRLQEILPTEGNALTLRIVRELRESLSFSEEEYAELGLEVREIDGKSAVAWAPEKDVGKEIEIGDVATTLIVGALKKLDQQQRLREHHLPLWERFVETHAAVREAEELTRGS